MEIEYMIRHLVSICIAMAGYVGVSRALAEDRSIDGTGNNLSPPRTTWGATDTNIPRIGYDADYPDGFGDTIHGPLTLPNPRDVSNAICAQSGPVYNARNLSDWIVQWGQFLTHDMDLTTNGATFDVLSTGATGDFSIPINDPGDILGPNPIAFHRSNYDPDTGDSDLIPAPEGTRPDWREQINSVTSFIDASNVYGSDATRATALRTGIDGKLATSAGGLLPGLNTAGLPNDDPLESGSSLFLAGDVRANEQVGLTATHALFVREHNRLADLLKVQNGSLTDEELYQKARKIVGAEMQIITYEEFLPALMGSTIVDPDAYNYSSMVNPSITNSFAAAFFRYGHSMQSSEIKLQNDDGTSNGSLSLRDAFFAPDILQNDPTLVDQVLLGLASQVSQENDVLMIDDIRNFLFGPPGAGGLDLAALDIQRGRDHGMLDFNSFRPTYDLTKLTSISQLTSNPNLQAAISALYGNINSIDAWVGGIAEDHVAGSSIGAMVMASLTDQFTRLRDGDRFFYTGDPNLLDADIQAVIDLNTITLAEIIRWNTGLTSVQDNVFFTLLEADFNANGTVGADDLNSWQASYNNDGNGDANGDGITGGSDFLVWQQQHTSSAVQASSSTLVPEPSGITLAAISCSFLIISQRRSI